MSVVKAASRPVRPRSSVPGRAWTAVRTIDAHQTRPQSAMTTTAPRSRSGRATTVSAALVTTWVSTAYAAPALAARVMPRMVQPTQRLRVCVSPAPGRTVPRTVRPSARRKPDPRSRRTWLRPRSPGSLGPAAAGSGASCGRGSCAAPSGCIVLLPAWPRAQVTDLHHVSRRRRAEAPRRKDHPEAGTGTCRGGSAGRRPRGSRLIDAPRLDDLEREHVQLDVARHAGPPELVERLPPRHATQRHEDADGGADVTAVGEGGLEVEGARLGGVETLERLEEVGLDRGQLLVGVVGRPEDRVDPVSGRGARHDVWLHAKTPTGTPPAAFARPRLARVKPRGPVRRMVPSGWGVRFVRYGGTRGGRLTRLSLGTRHPAPSSPFNQPGAAVTSPAGPTPDRQRDGTRSGDRVPPHPHHRGPRASVTTVGSAYAVTCVRGAPRAPCRAGRRRPRPGCGARSRAWRAGRTRSS